MPAGERLLLDSVKRRRCEKANVEVPTVRYFESDAEIQEMIEEDHQREFSQ